MDSNDALMQQDDVDAAQEEPDAAPDTPRSDHSLSIDPPSDPEPQPWRAPWTQLRCFYGRLGGAFGWRYVATVSLTYGVNQGVGEALLFGAQKYFFLDDLGLSAARASQLDGFSNIPWQIKAVYGMASDSYALWGGLRKAPYMVCAGVGGVLAALALGAARTRNVGAVALLLVVANLSIASPDVMVDGATAERCRTHPKLAADLQSLSWGSLYATSLLANVAMGYLVQPDVLGARGCFGLMTLTSLAVLLPAAAGWLGERRDDGAAAARAAPPKLDAQRSAVFRCAGATCATSLAIGNLQAFYRRDDADAVVGSLTVGLGLGLSLFIFRGLKTISRDLASAAVFIFLSGALSPATEVMFAWFHDDEKDGGNCAKRCAAGDEDCGWARDRGYPCIGSVYYGYMRATGRVFGLVGIILYNKYLSRWPYWRVFALGYLVTFLANLLDLVWVTRTNLALGLDDEFFLLGLEVVQPVVSRLASMPMFVLAAKLCPANVEATLFALLMGLSNFGSVVGIYNGVALLHLFGGVDAPEFPRLSAFVATRTLCYLAPFALVFVLVPAGGPDDDAEDDDGPAALELVGTDSAEERALV